MTLVAGGLNNREIAQALRTSVRTVATHVEHVLAKLDQRSRAGVSGIAVEQGLLRLPIPGDGVGLEGLTIGILDRRRGAPTPYPAVRSVSPHRPLPRRPLLVGSALPLSGPARGDGIEMRNGAALAIDEINTRGGVAGRRIEHVVVPTDIFDTNSVTASFDALMAAEVDAITSLYVFCEDEAMDRAALYGAPFLHAMTSEHMAKRTGEDPERYGRIFQVCPSEVHYGQGFVRFIDELAASGSWRPHRRSVLFVETRLQSSQMATANTLEAAARSGWDIAGVHYVAAQDADWSGVLEVVRATDPAAILVTDFLPTELAGFQRAFAARATDALVFAIYSPSVPAFLEEAGGAAEGLIWSTVTGTYGDQVGRGFMGRYAQRHGRPPGRSHAGIAYDEIHLLAQAWSAVDNPRDFGRVAERLRRQTFRGVNGSYHLDNEQQSALAYPDMTGRSVAQPGASGAAGAGWPASRAQSAAVRGSVVPNASVVLGATGPGLIAGRAAGQPSADQPRTRVTSRRKMRPLGGSVRYCGYFAASASCASSRSSGPSTSRAVTNARTHHRRDHSSS